MVDLNAPSLTVWCSTCPVREVHCADCMVTALADPTRHGWEFPLNSAERGAAAACVRAGLVSAQDVAWARASTPRATRTQPVKVS